MNIQRYAKSIKRIYCLEPFGQSWQYLRKKFTSILLKYPPFEGSFLKFSWAKQILVAKLIKIKMRKMLILAINYTFFG